MHKVVAASLVCLVLVPNVGLTRVIDEVVVTAERLSRPEGKSTGTITALDPTLLDSGAVQGIADLTAHVPGLDIKQSFGNQNPVLTLRGVGLNDFNANNNPATGVYIDGAYMPSPYLLGMRWFDLQRVDVLHGPQGTAFGRNTTAGAVAIASKRPSRDPSRMLRVGAAGYDAVNFEAVLSGGVSDRASARLAFVGDRGWSGPFRDQRGSKQGDVDRLAARGGLDIALSSTLSLYAQLHGGYDRSHGWHYTHQGTGNDDGTDFCAAALAGARDVSACRGPLGYQDNDGDPFSGAWSQLHRMDNRFMGGRLEAVWERPNYTLLSLTAYEWFARRNQEDADVSPAVILDVAYRNRFEVYSQELVATGGDDLLQWNVGLHLGRDVIDAQPNLFIASDDFLSTRLSVQWRQKTSTAAFFGHGRWQLGDRLALLTGARLNHESRKFDGSTTDLNPFDTSLLLAPGSQGAVILAATDELIDDTLVSGRLALEWTPTGADLFYLSVANGHKSGGFTGSFALSDEELAPFDRERVIAWEAGWKHRADEARFDLDLAAFHYKYADLQLFTTVDRAGAAVFLLSNAADARVSGADMKLRWQPSGGVALRLNVSWLHTEVRDFKGTPDVTGNELPNAPRLIVLPALELKHRLSRWDGMLRVQGEYRSRTYNEISNLHYLEQSGYTLWHAQASAKRALKDGGQFELSLWSRNLTDKRYFQEGFDQGAFFVNLRMLGMPRTSGLTATYHFL